MSVLQWFEMVKDNIDPVWFYVSTEKLKIAFSGVIKQHDPYSIVLDPQLGKSFVKDGLNGQAIIFAGASATSFFTSALIKGISGETVTIGITEVPKKLAEVGGTISNAVFPGSLTFRSTSLASKEWDITINEIGINGAIVTVSERNIALNRAAGLEVMMFGSIPVADKVFQLLINGKIKRSLPSPYSKTWTELYIEFAPSQTTNTAIQEIAQTYHKPVSIDLNPAKKRGLFGRLFGN